MKYTFQNKQFNTGFYSTKDNMTDLVDTVTNTPTISTPAQATPNIANPSSQSSPAPSSQDQTVQGSDGKPITLNIRFLGE